MELFLWPFAVLLLPLPWIVRKWVPDLHIKGAGNIADALRVPFFTRAAGLAHTTKPVSTMVLSSLLTVAWICFVIAAMRPIRYEENVPLPREARNIMLAIDFSTSMAKADFEWHGRPISRIEIVKNVVRDFIEKRNGDRLGLVVFGSNAYTLAPLSQDMKTLDELFIDVGLGVAGEQTAIGDALALSVQDTAKIPMGKKVIILLSDGYNNAGRITISQAIELAKQQGISVYTIGIGKQGRKSEKMFGLFDDDINSTWDEQGLRRIAQETGGHYFRAQSTNDLVEVYRKIDELETLDVEGQSVRPRRELFFYPLLLGMIFWIAAENRRRAK